MLLKRVYFPPANLNLIGLWERDFILSEWDDSSKQNSQNLWYCTHLFKPYYLYLYEAILKKIGEYEDDEVEGTFYGTHITRENIADFANEVEIFLIKLNGKDFFKTKLCDENSSKEVERINFGGYHTNLSEYYCYMSQFGRRKKRTEISRVFPKEEKADLIVNESLLNQICRRLFGFPWREDNWSGFWYENIDEVEKHNFKGERIELPSGLFYVGHPKPQNPVEIVHAGKFPSEFNDWVQWYVSYIKEIKLGKGMFSTPVPIGKESEDETIETESGFPEGHKKSRDYIGSLIRDARATIAGGIGGAITAIILGGSFLSGGEGEDLREMDIDFEDDATVHSARANARTVKDNPEIKTKNKSYKPYTLRSDSHMRGHSNDDLLKSDINRFGNKKNKDTLEKVVRINYRIYFIQNPAKLSVAEKITVSGKIYLFEVYNGTNIEKATIENYRDVQKILEERLELEDLDLLTHGLEIGNVILFIYKYKSKD